MLTNIKIQNAYSIKEAEISFVKGRFTYKKEMVDGDLVSPVVVYGMNGSGKTSVVNAINDLVNLLIGDYDGFYPLIANFNSKNDDSLIELTFKIDESTYQYHLSTSFTKSEIVNEYLSKDNEPIFTRNYKKIVIEDKEYEIENSLLVAIRYLCSNSEDLKYKKELKKVFDYLTNIAIVKGDNNLVTSTLCSYKNISELMMENSNEVKRVLSKYKDLTLFDLSKDEESEYVTLYFENNQKTRLPAFLISDGMESLLKLLTVMINLDKGALLVIDCVEKNLNLSSINLLIKEAKKREIQLLLTSHNTALMQELRPDQIYFARFRNGFSYYFKLSNIYDNIRKINNIEKMYLSNTFNEAINETINLEGK